MLSQKLIGKCKVSRGVVIYVKRKPLLHGKRVSNNSLVVIKLIATKCCWKVTLPTENNNKESRNENQERKGNWRKVNLSLGYLVTYKDRLGSSTTRNFNPQEILGCTNNKKYLAY